VGVTVGETVAETMGATASHIVGETMFDPLVVSDYEEQGILLPSRKWYKTERIAHRIPVHSRGSPVPGTEKSDTLP
jgi:hypothetical protein